MTKYSINSLLLNLSSYYTNDIPFLLIIQIIWIFTIELVVVLFQTTVFETSMETLLNMFVCILSSVFPKHSSNQNYLRSHLWRATVSQAIYLEQLSFKQLYSQLLHFRLAISIYSSQANPYFRLGLAYSIYSSQANDWGANRV